MFTKKTNRTTVKTLPPSVIRRSFTISRLIPEQFRKESSLFVDNRQDHSSQCRCCREWSRSQDKKRVAVLCDILNKHIRFIFLNPFDLRSINPFELDLTFLHFYHQPPYCYFAVVLICTDPGCNTGYPFECDLYSYTVVDFLLLPFRVPS
jgi:hypothetical protein